MDLFERFVAAEKQFFAYFGYYPSLSSYPERHLIIDCRKHHWLLVSSQEHWVVCYSAGPLTGLKLEIGQGIFSEEIMTWLGTNRKMGKRGGVWRGHEYTLVASSLFEGEHHYLVFSNANECRSPFLVKLAGMQFLV